MAQGQDRRKSRTEALTVGQRLYIISSTRGMKTMTINITNKEADRLTRRLAEMEGVGLTEAVVIAVSEAIERRRQRETPIETAARLRAEFGITLTEKAREPLPKSFFDELSGDL